MADRPELDPYAPPRAELEPPPASVAAPAAAAAPTAGEIAAALRRLREHVASPQLLAADARAAGPLLRPVTLVLAALFVLALIAAGGLAATGGADDGRSRLFVAGGLAVFLGILAAALSFADLSLGRRDAPVAPEIALKRFLKALSAGRDGFAWSALCPTARERSVAVPRLDPVPTEEGVFAMSAPAGVKGYARSFARPGKKQMRTMRVKALGARSPEDGLAVVEATLHFQSWPKWITMLLAVSAAVFRLGVIVAAVLFFVMRKRVEVKVAKVLLQGQPGVWYLFDADVLEGYGQCGSVRASGLGALASPAAPSVLSRK